MESVEDLEKKLETKLQLLILMKTESERIIKRRKIKDIESQIENIEGPITEIRSVKRQIQELKLARNETLEVVTAWSSEIEEKLNEYDAYIDELTNIVENLKEQHKVARMKHQEEVDSMKFQQRLEEEKQIELMKLQVRKSEEERHGAKAKEHIEKVNVKLPKLVITPFSGTFLDWLRFWGQFEIEIDKAQLTPVGKFSYLKELVSPKVRVLIDGLPFNTEGYERAKTILKTKYDRPTEVANAHIQAIMNLPIISHLSFPRIHEFYESLVNHVQALETMQKLADIKGYVRNTLDKLPVIRSDLLQSQDNWQDWGYKELINALQRWVDRNPINQHDRRTNEPKRDRFLHINQKEQKPKSCVYCNKDDHKPNDCKNVTNIEERKKILSTKRLCFNCTGEKHRANECKSKRKCRLCNESHHTSICTKDRSAMLTTVESGVIYPIVIVQVNNIKCRALLDSAAGNSYASSALLRRIKAKPKGQVLKQIEMMMTTSVQKLEVYDLTIENVTGNFKLNTEVRKVERENLIQVPNPKYRNVLQSYPHLKDVTVIDDDPKSELPVHIVLGISDYTKVKEREAPKIGNYGEPIAELTEFGWVLASPGNENRNTTSFLTGSSIADFNRLCDLDVLGVSRVELSSQDSMYDEFKKQLRWNPEGYYETNFMWKQGHPELSDNKEASLARLRNLHKKLSRSPEVFKEYDSIIQKHIQDGIVEKVDHHEPTDNRTFYLPHRAVIRESAETTKLRIVYDASSKPSTNSPSLNECLESDPCLQNLLWNILVRIRFKPIVLCGDLQKAFWQIRVRESERNSLRFHWLKDRDPSQIAILRFTRVLFGLTQSPFILEATLKEHFQKYIDIFPQTVAKLKEDLYVDDLVTGDHNEENVKELKKSAISIFKDGGFTLHKWHSNKSLLEGNDFVDKVEQTYAKKQLGVKPDDTKILGIHWNKGYDQFSVEFPKKIETVTKRTILRKLAQIYDPLGFASPVTLIGKSIFRTVCESKIQWDENLPSKLMSIWRKWESNLPQKVNIPRSIYLSEEELTVVDIYVFGDASLTGTCTVSYAVITQPSSIKQGLITSKSRLSKRNQTIPRLELVAAQMSVNLAENIRNALSTCNLRHTYAWSDSTVVLYWILGRDPYKPFVQNRVDYIREKTNIEWRHVPTLQNPADIGSRGSTASNLDERWFKGPPWLSHPENYIGFYCEQKRFEGNPQFESVRVYSIICGKIFL